MDNNIYIIIIILLAFIFYIFDNYLYLRDEYIEEHFSADNSDKKVEIIIARYNEDLKWTLEAPFNQYKYIVYNKGDNENFEKTNVKQIITLPNVGKCDHTYLYHVVNNYNNLSDIVVFFPGSLDLKYKRKIGVKLLKEINIRNNAIFISLNEYDIKKLHYNFKMSHYKTKHIKNSSKNGESELKKSSIRPFGLWFENMFGDLKINCLIYYGIFSIDRNDILQHPVSRYEVLIKDLSDHSNPEVGHYFERSWCAVFHPLKNTNVIKYNKL
jgi:hypothetical protein